MNENNYILKTKQDEDENKAIIYLNLFICMYTTHTHIHHLHHIHHKNTHTITTTKQTHSHQP